MAKKEVRMGSAVLFPLPKGEVVKIRDLTIAPWMARMLEEEGRKHARELGIEYPTRGARQGEIRLVLDRYRRLTGYRDTQTREGEEKG